jgi:hypothetical protein
MLAAGIYWFILFVEYDTERGMMRWTESEEDLAEVESGRRSVRSHELVRSELGRGAQPGNIVNETRHETVSPH